jgi:hypothetical protein
MWLFAQSCGNFSASSIWCTLAPLKKSTFFWGALYYIRLMMQKISRKIVQTITFHSLDCISTQQTKCRRSKDERGEDLRERRILGELYRIWLFVSPLYRFVQTGARPLLFLSGWSYGHSHLVCWSDMQSNEWNVVVCTILREFFCIINLMHFSSPQKKYFFLGALYYIRLMMQKNFRKIVQTTAFHPLDCISTQQTKCRRARDEWDKNGRERPGSCKTVDFRQ